MSDVVVKDTGDKLTMEIAVGDHRLIADEVKAIGGQELGPAPHEFLLAGLGACTAMTVKLYAARKQWPLEHVSVRLSRRKVKAADCPDCNSTEGEVEEITREITLEGPLDAEMRARLLEIAGKCPVHKTLAGEIKIRTRLV